LGWDFAFLADNPVVRTKRFGITAEAKSVRYPVRLLRYWFGYHLLRVEADRLGRPMDVAEVGVHTGQFLEFVKSTPVVPTFARWTAVDVVMLEEKLRKAGYDDFFEANLEAPDFALPGEYDAAVMLHVLEHLFEPEEALRKVVSGLRAGGIVIGGFPVLPGMLVQSREAAVRKTANLHTGGTIHDVTEQLHPTLKNAAEYASRVLGIPVTGLDFLVPAVDGPDYVIIEANERPGLANHEPQPTAQRFVDLLFPLTATAQVSP